MDQAKTFYRVCNLATQQGLWYDFKGTFTGLIHDRLSFCHNKDLRMDFDPDVVGWLSAVEHLDELWKWFPKQDVVRLQAHGWYVCEYLATDYRFYERFQHMLIKQSTSIEGHAHVITL